MRRSQWVILFCAGLIIPIAVAIFQTEPGYMDADYYFIGGLRLAQRHGFSEMVLWNYLDDPSALPHPSHGYWMPLASIVAAISMILSGRLDFFGARLAFMLISACVPLVTAALAYHLSSNRELAMISGLLAAFSGYHAPFLATTDNFSIYMLLGGFFFLIMTRPGRLSALVLGLVAGLMQLARSDGLIWLAFALIVISSRTLFPLKNISRWSIVSLIPELFFVICGYLISMGPWMARNYLAFGSLMAPGTQRAMFLTSYDDTFAYPPTRLTFDYLLQSGWKAILDARLWSLQQNLLNAFAAQGAIILAPFILVGAWQKRSDARVRLGVAGWVLLLTAMTVVFPFAGGRGSFFHSGAAFQSLWWSLAPIGLDRIVDAVRSRNWLDARAYKLFRFGLVLICLALTLVLIYIRVIQNGWNGTTALYSQVERVLIEHGAQDHEAVIVVNPPGYFMVTGRSAIVLPVGDDQSLVLAAEQFDARYLVLEENYLSENTKPIFDHPKDHAHYELIADLGETRVFYVSP